jgi:peptide/nickel transport system permease protein
VVVLAIGGEVFAPFGANEISRELLVVPNGAHPMGTDNLGRDILSRAIVGTRATLMVGFLAALVGASIGMVIGAAAGFRGGWLDTVAMRFSEMIQVLPKFLLAVLVIALFGPGIDRVILVIGFLSWPVMARLTRGQFLALKDMTFVEAARSLGLRNRHLIVREILPNAMPPLVVQLTFDMASAIVVEAGLGFLGLSDPNFLTWGAMLQDAQRYLVRAWWFGVFPGVAILVTVASFNLVGDGLNDRFNPRRRGR